LIRAAIDFLTGDCRGFGGGLDLLPSSGPRAGKAEFD
jgi:hypothetical protein